jgi:DNA-directed RNA polymerase subunit RPC12/RpoP
MDKLKCYNCGREFDDTGAPVVRCPDCTYLVRVRGLALLPCKNPAKAVKIGCKTGQPSYPVKYTVCPLEALKQAVSASNGECPYKEQVRIWTVTENENGQIEIIMSDATVCQRCKPCPIRCELQRYYQ